MEREQKLTLVSRSWARSTSTVEPVLPFVDGLNFAPVTWGVDLLQSDSGLQSCRSVGRSKLKLRIEAGESVSIQEAVDEQLNSKSGLWPPFNMVTKACQSKLRPIKVIGS